MMTNTKLTFRIAAYVVALIAGMEFQLARSGAFVCDATCLSKLASVSSIALNADKAVSGVKGAGAVVSHPFHPVAAWKRARGKKTK